MARLSLVGVSLVAGVSLMLAGVAYGAGGTSVGAYGGVAGKTQGAIHQAGLGNTKGTLPFTGLNLTLIVAASVLLLLTGLLLHRRSGRSSR